jgi:DNA-binding NarL/FixJ family response regulator
VVPSTVFLGVRIGVMECPIDEDRCDRWVIRASPEQGMAARGRPAGTVGPVPHPIRRVLLVHGPATDVAAIRAHLGVAATVSLADVCATAADALDVLDPARHDVLVVDSALADSTGAELVAAVRELLPDVVAVALVDDDPAAVADAIRSGADAVVRRGAAASCLSAAVGAVGPHRRVLDPGSAALLAAAWPDEPAQLLSAREMDVLECLAAGLTNAQVATRLYVSRETVKTHVAHVLRKLEVGDRSAAVARARRLGLIDEPLEPAGLLA